jgi:hypothetical protein
MARLRQFLREPLMHFFLLGAALFVAFALVHGRSPERPSQIVVTPGDLEQLIVKFARTWQRPPTPQELDGLIDDYIREEISSREALAMGLDRHDLGDPFLLPTEFALSPWDEIARLFGEAFTGQLLRLEPGRWAGPIASTYGQHLVLIRERTEGRVPDLELELRQTSPESFEVRWKVPARNDLRLAIHPQFPEHCTWASEQVSFLSADAYHERASLSCPGGLDGRRIAIDGLTATLTDVLVRIARTDGAVRVVRLTPSAPSLLVEAAPSQLQKTMTYLRLGVEHILLGIDHLLFVLGLLLIVKDRRMLLKTITSFKQT